MSPARPRTYLVTGAASGIGEATAARLRARGHTVLGADLAGADIDADLSAPEGRTRLVDRARELSGGRLDAVIADAALAGDESAATAAAEAAVQRGEGHAVYGSSKNALARWVRRTAATAAWAGAGIPLNAIAPGTVLTPMTEPMLAAPGVREVVDAVIPMPLNGRAAAEQATPLLDFLTSPENTHVTGQIVFIDGGADATLRGEGAW
ncbi:SDR family oxidoreductase [Streptomyces sp. NBC_01343]|uniref:SDR family oxidoreductase n=1 Tax=Streptomyces sp. NBC_01343 TaxID=2903832 RepID=UPI002E0E9160|nr:SDR family oxidoreductase [Streptomyces sp. NBC_01343]